MSLVLDFPQFSIPSQPPEVSDTLPALNLDSWAGILKRADPGAGDWSRAGSRERAQGPWHPSQGLLQQLQPCTKHRHGKGTFWSTSRQNLSCFSQLHEYLSSAIPNFGSTGTEQSFHASTATLKVLSGHKDFGVKHDARLVIILVSLNGEGSSPQNSKRK